MTTVTKCSLSFYFILLPTNRQNGLSLGAPWSMVNKTEIENLVFEKKILYFLIFMFFGYRKKVFSIPRQFYEKKTSSEIKRKVLIIQEKL